jgi:hypothetical protein
VKTRSTIRRSRKGARDNRGTEDILNSKRGVDRETRESGIKKSNTVDGGNLSALGCRGETAAVRARSARLGPVRRNPSEKIGRVGSVDNPEKKKKLVLALGD